MIINGRPYTNENGHVDDALVISKDVEELKKIDEWIRKNIRRSRKICDHDSYRLKHDMEKDNHIYLTNNAFKDAMLLAGYDPVDPNELNWRYRIELAMNVNTNPFLQWVKKNNFVDESSPEGEFARVLVQDETFPIFAEYSLIINYLGPGARMDVLDAFEKLWKMYEREKND